MTPLASVRASSTVLAAAGLAEPVPAWLSEAERTRILRLRRPEDRRDATAARVLVRQLVSASTGQPPEHINLAQHCPVCQAHGHGRPFLPAHPNLHVSFAHVEGWVSAVIASGPCGIDIELRQRMPVRLRSALHPNEARWADHHDDANQALAILWVAKEALVKAGRCDLDQFAEVALIHGGQLRQDVYDCRLTWLDLGRSHALATPQPIRGQACTGYQQAPTDRSMALNSASYPFSMAPLGSVNSPAPTAAVAIRMDGLPENDLHPRFI